MLQQPITLASALLAIMQHQQAPFQVGRRVEINPDGLVTIEKIAAWQDMVGRVESRPDGKVVAIIFRDGSGLHYDPVMNWWCDRTPEVEAAMRDTRALELEVTPLPRLRAL